MDTGDLKKGGQIESDVSTVKENTRGTIPADTHVDGTSRIQAVPDGGSRYRRLLERFQKITGVPMLLNTSFNLKREPIVNSPVDALSTFDKSGLDMLVLENTIVHSQDN